jgi:hypothetical protein
VSPKKKNSARNRIKIKGANVRNALVDEAYQRSVYERAQPTGGVDPRTVGGLMTDPEVDDSHARNSVVLDMTDALLMSGMSVAEVETYYKGVPGEQVAFIQIDGRINKTDRQVSLAVIANTDAVAAFITELLALASRSGAEYLDDLTRRLTELHQGKHVDLPWLRAAIDNAMELDEEL